MADETHKPKDPVADAEGTGKPHKLTKAEQAKLPGGADFDVEGASSEDFDKHYEILERRRKIASLATPEPVATTLSVGEATLAKAEPTPPAPGDIRAVKDGEVRYFTDITWKAMETPNAKHTHAGWEIAVDKPKDI